MAFLTLLLALLYLPFMGKGQRIAEEKANLSSLRFVHAIWRHGDRSPTKVLPSDEENTLEKWKQRFGGLGQLTDLGAQQHFELGKLLRRRYESFLPDQFDPLELVYRPSAFNRTQMSLLANLQGMFSPNNQNGPKMPLEGNAPRELAISFLPLGQDPIVFDEVECPEASRLEDEVFEGEEFKQLEHANEPFLRMMAQLAGLDELPLRSIYRVHDPINSIFLHQFDGFSLPRWANESIRAELFRLYNLKNSFNFKSHFLRRFWSGPLFTEILYRMANASLNERRYGQKFQAYSGHDLTIAGQLAILGIFPDVFPTFANAILIELHQNGTHCPPFVRLFHKNETNSDHFWEYQIPECGSPCTLRQLMDSRRAFAIESDQWKEECGRMCQENGLSI